MYDGNYTDPDISSTSDMEQDEGDGVDEGESDSESSSVDDALLFMENLINGDEHEENYSHDTRIVLDVSPWTLLNIGAFMAMFVCLNLTLMWKNKRANTIASKHIVEDDIEFGSI